LSARRLSGNVARIVLFGRQTLPTQIIFLKERDMAKEIRKLITPPFRLSFPNLFVARKASDDPGAKPKYGCSAIWTPAKFTDRDKKLWNAILADLDRVSREAFKKAWKDLDPSTFKKGLRDGAAKDGLEGYGQGTRFANLTSNQRPGVIDIDRSDISPEDGNTDLIYPGCYCRATVNVYSFDTKGKGVALGLRNIQKVKDGARLDSRTAATDDFDEDVDSSWLDSDDGESDDDSNFG
jgi:hypothetical protein